MPDSLWPHGLQPTGFLSPWYFTGKDTGMGCHFLLQGIFPTQGLNPGLLHCRQILYQLSYNIHEVQYYNPRTEDDSSFLHLKNFLLKFYYVLVCALNILVWLGISYYIISVNRAFPRSPSNWIVNVHKGTIDFAFLMLSQWPKFKLLIIRK